MCHLAIVNVYVITILSIGNTEISILLLCFLYLFVELMITMNEYILFKPNKEKKMDWNIIGAMIFWTTYFSRAPTVCVVNLSTLLTKTTILNHTSFTSHAVKLTTTPG